MASGDPSSSGQKKKIVSKLSLDEFKTRVPLPVFPYYEPRVNVPRTRIKTYHANARSGEVNDSRPEKHVGIKDIAAVAINPTLPMVSAGTLESFPALSTVPLTPPLLIIPSIPVVTTAATIPASLAVQPVAPVVTSVVPSVVRHMHILRGIPFSGKSYMANAWKNKAETKGLTCTVVSADDYFTSSATGIYTFDPSKLNVAHDFCYTRAQAAVLGGINVLVIDNTNCQVWEMKRYVELANKYRYTISIHEPITKWARDVTHCSKNGKRVPHTHIARMLSNLLSSTRSSDAELIRDILRSVPPPGMGGTTK